METIKADVLIIGSGIAGLYAAKLLSNKKKVILITKSNVTHSNSYLAQGGIAASIYEKDHWKNHYLDTLTAGNFHHIEEATELMIKHAPDLIKELIQLGVPFDRQENGSLSLGREGGHHKRRIVHAGGDATGKNVINHLLKSIENEIRIDEQVTAYDLVIFEGHCVGAIAKNRKDETIFYQAQHTIMATGGAGGLYPVTSNSPTITGDGLAMAYRAGAELADLEFMQFHPTVLFYDGKAHGLISEAVRGEGAKLVNQDGISIMEGIHPLKDLAPRDVVARQIYDVMNQGDQVFLDISMIKDFSKRFPSITQICIESGLDLQIQLLPISPAAHFLMGGIKTNSSGETSIPRLYAIGETAFTGVHGSNRLASNSLLEGLFFAKQTAESILLKIDIEGEPLFPFPFIHESNQQIEISLPSQEEIREIMLKYVGIVRTPEGLTFAKQWFESFLSTINVIKTILLTKDQLTRLNMLTVGWLMITSALERKESRGAHFRTDFPNEDELNWRKRYIVRRRETNEYDQIKETFATAIY
ncbi:L-aspartate oxidase [Tepidibacillus fermentans]|uniref:L-aspartate oxidase n=1 Tax=Tepidibacillus fermentans TaxID=1281767 RepID=A0A4R3KI35_9BACI|nr:L-aspartate oxidase [Tepidibacillus fermentans]TCS83173.1 L-aspartate oxidase [Tepidibacillus fermentans]